MKFVKIFFPIFVLPAILNISDSLIILSDEFFWSPSYHLLFKTSSAKQWKHTIGLTNVNYRPSLVIIGIFGFLWVNVLVIKRAINDYSNADVWWYFLGVMCLVMPSIPIAIQVL